MPVKNDVNKVNAAFCRMGLLFFFFSSFRPPCGVCLPDVLDHVLLEISAFRPYPLGRCAHAAADTSPLRRRARGRRDFPGRNRPSSRWRGEQKKKHDFPNFGTGRYRRRNNCAPANHARPAETSADIGSRWPDERLAQLYALRRNRATPV